MQKEDQKKPTLKQVTEVNEAHAPNYSSLAEPGYAAAMGEQIQLDDRYEVIEKIGEGGMGSVYKVRDRVLEKDFAVKVVKPELLKDNTAMKRFEQEAQGAIALTHPNLVSVYGHKLSKSGQPFLLMDYHEGSSLQEVLRERGKILPDQSVDLFLKLTDALTHAHAKGIIHRDLKPSNIIIDENEMGQMEPKVVDFGISKILNANITTMGFTKEQHTFGSPQYMSPEMCRGDKLDARSDIYSLGCVMYEVLEGKPPYQMDNPFQTLMQHVSGDMPKFAQPSAVPGPLQGIVLKCLEKDPADRYQSMEQLRRDFERYRAGQKLEFAKARKPLKVRKHQLAIAGGAIACFVAGVMLTSLKDGFPGAPSAVSPNLATPSVPPAASGTDSADGLLDWKLPDANPNDPEALIRRLAAADDQSDLRKLMSDRKIAWEQRRLREEAARVLEKKTETQLAALGERVIPTVLNHLFDEQRLVRECCTQVLKNLGTVAAKPAVEKVMSSGYVSTYDYQILDVLASIGKPAVKELLQYVDKPGDTQSRALKLLLLTLTRVPEGLDVSDAPTLIKLIESASVSAEDRKLAALALVMVGDRSEEVRNLYVKLAQTPGDTDLRVAAISALGAIASTESADSSAETQNIIGKIATSDKDAYIRFAATANLGALGTKAKGMAPTLTKLSKDRDASTAMAAKTGLCLIEGNTMSSRSMRSTEAPAFIGEINSSISQEQLAEKVRGFGGVVSRAPFERFPTHPDFCGFAVPTLMQYLDTSGDRVFDKRYGYEVLGSLKHYGNPAMAWLVMKGSRDNAHSSASQAISGILGLRQR